ncbi:MAG: nuclear transport factor 2 family protein, partial [Methylococcaceae bacterium]|nr:nuclear transport factor 2 family protein [Methylococcaceae bacterium]
NYQWEWQKDFFDLGNVKDLFMQLAADGKLERPVKQKLRRLAWGLKLPGVEPIHADLSIWQKLKGILAMLRIVLFG